MHIFHLAAFPCYSGSVHCQNELHNTCLQCIVLDCMQHLVCFVCSLLTLIEGDLTANVSVATRLKA